MGSLTELQILSRARASSLENVKNLNFWGSDICDVSVLRKMPNVEVLSLSANGIFDLKDFAHCPRLRELYLRRNKIDDIKQIGYLKNLPRLRVLWLSDNPCAEDPNYRSTVLKTLPRLTKLDNIVVAPEDVNNAVTEGVEVETPDCIPCYPDVQDTTSKTLLGSSVENGTELPDQSGKVTQDGGSPIKAKSLVDETNRLRAELGLKQLDLNGSSNHNITTVAIATTKPSFSTPSRPGRPASVESGKVTQDGGSPIKAKSLVDETNRLRAELGLKQLDLNGSSNHNITTVAIATTKPSFSKPSRPGRSASVESRNANILTAVLTLVKELDKACLLELKNEVDDLLQEFESNDEQTVSLTTAAAKDLLTG